MTILTENIVHKAFNQSAVTSVLANYLIRNFSDCEYHSTYEAGIPTRQKEMFQKNALWTVKKLQRP